MNVKMNVKEIITLGSSTRSPQEFIDLLKSRHIHTLIDIRSFPTSKFEHFKQQNLQSILEEAGIRYVYLGRELGGYRKGGYQAYTETRSYKDGLSRVEEMAKKKRCAIMCAERLPWKCHRRFIGNSLKMLGWRVIHVIDKKRIWEPTS